MIVRYIGATDAQVAWGSCSDPRGVLRLGEIYLVEDKKIHSWHTKLKLENYEGWFNSVCFEDISYDDV